MSRSTIACRTATCRRHLGWLQGDRLRPSAEVVVVHHLGKGYADLRCPGCGRDRRFSDGVIESRAA